MDLIRVSYSGGIYPWHEFDIMGDELEFFGKIFLVLKI
jgi:hypothetical protein